MKKFVFIVALACLIIISFFDFFYWPSKKTSLSPQKNENFYALSAPLPLRAEFANMGWSELRSNIFALKDSELAAAARKLGLLPIAWANEAKSILDSSEFFIPSSKEREELGKRLFFDSRLSRSKLISCNFCHDLARSGTDNIATSIGDKWQKNPQHINSPTVFNAVLNASQFWDGRAANLFEQAKAPLIASVEMASSDEVIRQNIGTLKAYKKEFLQAFGTDEINIDLVAAAIAVFERTLVLKNRFDDFLAGDERALNDDEKMGLRYFLQKGCVLCHNGINIGGGFRFFDFFEYQYQDVGGFRGNSHGWVKVPSLRNIANTAPYFHNGMVTSLYEAVESMGRIQLKIELSDDEIRKILAFLHSLSNENYEIKTPKLWMK